MTSRYCKLLFALLILSLIPIQNCGPKLDINEMMDEWKRNNCKLVIVELKKVRLWDYELGMLMPLFPHREFRYNQPYESIDQPCLCLENTKLLLAKNEGIGKFGKLLLVDINDGIEKVIYHGKAIKSPVMSPDGKTIAFLSDIEWGKCSLFILDMPSMKVRCIVNNRNVHGKGFNFNISWMPDSQQLLYSDITGHIKLVNVNNGKTESIIPGYDPVCSPDGQKILFKKKPYKPYKPYIYDFKTNRTCKIKLSRLYNAIWSPDGKYLLAVISIASILRWNELEKEVVLVDIVTKEKASLFKYEGFQYIDCKYGE